MENILNYLDRLLLSLSVEAIIIISVFVLLGIILLIVLLLQDKQIKECCKTNNQLRNQLLVFEKRNENLTEDNENLKKHIELLQEAAEKQAEEYNELQKEFNAISDEYQKKLRIIERSGIQRNLRGQFEKIKNT